MSGVSDPSPLAGLARSVVDSITASPGMTAAVGAGPVGDALAAELRRRGISPVAGGEPVGSCLHEEPQRLEPGLLRHRRERLHGLLRFHASTLLERSRACRP